MANCAVQEAVVPAGIDPVTGDPVHVQLYGPAPMIAVGVPDEHRFVISAWVTKFPPFDVPHAPLRGAPHEALDPLKLLPKQVHVHAFGFVPKTVAVVYV